MSALALDHFAEVALLAAFRVGLRSASANCELLTDGRLTVSSAEIRRLSIGAVLASAGGPETLVAAIYVGFSGALSGHGILLLPAAEAGALARGLVEGLTPNDDLPDTLDDGVPANEDGADAGLTTLEQSALEELANVAVSSVLIGLGDHLGEPIHPSVPSFRFDMAGAVLDGIVSDLAEAGDGVLAARTTFSRAGRTSTGVLLVMPRLSSGHGADNAACTAPTAGG